MNLYAQEKPIEPLKPVEKIEKPAVETVAEVKVEEPKPSVDQPMDTGLIGIVVMVAIAMNVVLAAASKILDMIKDKTSTQVDNKIASVISKIASVLSKVIDYAGMNRSHK